ncbi:MAG TPA: M36 family metallopeptidase, partial [Thermoanaerobaculia bacterium]|nr:M36 family metallopeptidase [Thermoanaerobaculia bacterium]
MSALPASAVTTVPEDHASKAELARNFDLRAELPAAEATALSPETTRAIDALRRSLPELRVTIDGNTGATRTLSNAVGFLTGPQRGADAEAVALGFAYGELDLLGLTAADLADYEVTDSVYSEATGVTHLYLRQRLAGIPVYNGQLHFNVAGDGRILSINNQFVPDLAGAVTATSPALDADAAAAAAVAHSTQVARTGARPVSEPRLMYLPVRPGEARLVWNLQVETADSNHWFDFTVDAVDGRVWTRFDWVANANYRVYQRPVEAPTFIAPLPPADGRTLQVNPQNATASPFGWHDTNGAAGAEFTIMRGNNVHSYDDIDNNNTPPAGEPDCGGALNCDFPINLTLAPNQYIPAAVTNLFYWNNVIHDVAFLYGFDSAGGNFQVNTYGGGGVGNDDVRAEAQDGAGTNNANFFTPADGSRPRMQMFIWTLGTPNRDGDLDAGIIAHEYGHGISNRLVGGPANVSCLGNSEQPGEGLSDWWSLFYTFEASNPSVRGIGTYALFQPTNGAGIRTQRYDKDPEPNTNTWTYGSLPGSAIPHGVGEKWAQAFWYVQGRLEDEHGFDANVYNYTGGAGDAGNIRAMYYIIEGLKNSVCTPGFVDVRDGIIQAATTAYGGADVCLLWQAFADFGLGFSASQGSSGSINDQTPAFDLPTSCSFGSAGGDAGVCAGSNHIQSILVGPAFSPPVAMSATGNPAPSTVSFSPNPVPGPLPQNTQLTIGNTGSVAAGTYTINVTGNDGTPTPIGSFDLTVDVGSPAAPVLTAPVNSTSGHPVRPTFQWNAAAGASEYLLEVDDDADFSSLVYSA